MKKYTIILLLLGLTSMMDANAGHRGHHPGQACQYLKIIIKNDTPFHCYMIKRTLKMGDIYETASFKIPSGTENTAFELSEYNGQIHMTLTYECNEGRTITFSSTKNACAKSGTITGKKLSTQNMDATFSITPGSYWAGTPGIIHWTFY
ncbi:MAG: hypothetical protein CK424_02050 [Legionella sp.]|nr:MAG: hypothetical protein CK424_02050 [Legionella sp.]